MASRLGYEPLGEVPSACCRCCKTWSRALKAFVVGVVSLFLLGVFGAVYYAVHIIVNEKIAEGAVLVNGTLAEKQWQSPEIPIYTKFYFFDVDNPFEVQKEGAKPSVTQRGPYTYREYKNKLHVRWSENKTTVSYCLQDYFVFDRSKSVGDVREDQITSLNLILVTVLDVIHQKLHFFPEKVVTEIIKLATNEELFMKRPIHDLLWGYDDTLLKLFNKLDSQIPKSFSLQHNVSTPDPSKPCQVYTGVGDTSRVGQFIEWNGVTKLPYWKTDTANTLKGTEGFLFKPGNGKERIYIFVDQIFRSGYFDYSGSSEIKGISVNRFQMPDKEMANASVNPANAAYYSNGPSGLGNMTPCVPMNAPVFSSKPHFLGAESILREAVAHLRPNRSLHDSYLDMEPMTGAVFRAAKRLQINVKIERNSDIVQLQHVPSLYFPLFWVEETAEITDDLADQFKSELLIPTTVAYDSLIALMVAAGFTSVVCFLLAAWFKFSHDERGLSVSNSTVQR